MSAGGWAVVASRVLAESRLFRIMCDRIRSPRTGREFDFYSIHMCDWVQVVPVTATGEVVLVRQYRHGSRTVDLEVPGGLADASEEKPDEAAVRELMEETGYGGGKVVPLGAFHPQPALLTNRVHFFLARGVWRQRAPEQDPGEDIEVVVLARDEVERRIASGEIRSAMTVMALALAGMLRRTVPRQEGDR